MIKSSFSRLAQLCAYSHMIKVFQVLIRGGDLSQQTRAGRNIALLGFFCPFFWVALFSGASKSELIFHATHSGSVFVIGLVIMLVSLRKQKQM